MNTREADQKIIEQGLAHSDPLVKRQAQRARYQINNESAKVASMREALVKAHRDGNLEEIRDIHDYIRSKPDYQRYG